MNEQVSRVCNPSQVALNIAVGSATIANAVTSQCSTPVVTVPSSRGSSVTRVPRWPLGSTKASIRTPVDVADVWTHLNWGDQIALWCEGVRRKTLHSAELSDSESDEETSKKRKRSKKKKLSALDKKTNRVEDIVCTLREKHGDHYTTIQYRLWVEMVDIGTHRLEFDLRVYVLVAQCHVLCTGVSFGTQPFSTAWDCILRLCHMAHH